MFQETWKLGEYSDVTFVSFIQDWLWNAWLAMYCRTGYCPCLVWLDLICLNGYVLSDWVWLVWLSWVLCFDCSQPPQGRGQVDLPDFLRLKTQPAPAPAPYYDTGTDTGRLFNTELHKRFLCGQVTSSTAFCTFIFPPCHFVIYNINMWYCDMGIKYFFILSTFPPTKFRYWWWRCC